MEPRRNNDLARLDVREAALDEGYRVMAADERHESEAAEWANALVEDIAADS
jgi:hypothetical protein